MKKLILLVSLAATFGCATQNQDPKSKPAVSTTAKQIAMTGDTCGSLAGIRCDEGLICSRPPGFDRSGTCVDPADGELCGGFGNEKCPDGFTCHTDGAIDDEPGVCLAS